MKKPAVFLDRDGVINRDRPDYVKSWAEFEFLPGILNTLRCLSEFPYAIVIVSNQSAIGRGLVSEDTVEKIHLNMIQALRNYGGRLDAIYYCPHAPEDGCDCRKPYPGLLSRAADDLNLDLPKSWFIGDSLRDLEAAIAVGVHPVLVRTGHGNVVLPDLIPSQTIILNDLAHVVDTQIDRFLA
tara:strand:+ start:679 stop:1227 length:549 start_codon:yes stop_codon:yes gene_type:complete